MGVGISSEVTSMVVRLIDYLKTKGVTLFMTSLNEGGETLDRAGANISSVVDSWILLRNVETEGARIRTLSILKSRGMAHSSLTHPFALTSKGVTLGRAPSVQGTG